MSHEEGELTPQAKAALATYLLMMYEEMTTAEICRHTGITTRQGVLYLMDNLSSGGVPVYQPTPGRWAISPGGRRNRANVAAVTDTNQFNF